MTNSYLINGYFKCLKLDFDFEKFSECEFQTSAEISQDLSYNYPAVISNSIIEFRNFNIKIFIQSLRYFQELQCKYITLILLDEIGIKMFKKITSEIERYNIHRCLFLFKFSDFFLSEDFILLINNFNKTNGFVIFNSHFDKNYENTVHFVQQDFKIRNDKTIFEFACNRILFSESQYHHTYFNRKLYIGPNGEIKNAPECEETFGNIKDLNSVEDLKEIISTPAFQKYWFVHKDLCDVCKHCEFRHMCVDNRMPFERADNKWYHKIECNYNPFIAKWKGELGFRTLSECGVISNENEFSIDHDRIAEINKEIWEEE